MITNTSTGTLGVLNATVVLSTDVADSHSIQITGTWAGTITFECSLDNVNWFSEAVVSSAGTTITTAVTTTTANGIWSSDSFGITYVRVRMSSYTSGTANIVMASSRSAK